MKILFPIGSIFPSQNGGPSNSIYWICKELNKLNFETTVVSTNSGINEEIITNKWINSDFGKVIYLKNFSNFFPLRSILFSIIQIKKNDIIHLTSFFYPLTWFVLIYAIAKKKIVILSPRGELDDEALIYNSRIKKVIIKCVSFISKNKIIMHATTIQEANFIKKNFNKSIEIKVIPNYLPINEEKNGMVENYFLYIGRIHPKKNIHTLLISFSNSVEFINSNFELRIVGDFQNSYGKELKRFVSENELSEKIQFLGHVEGISKDDLYSNAYFTILPSNTENFGNVVVESLMFGTPVIASNGTPWEILNKLNAGYWVENNSDSYQKIINSAIALDEKTYLTMRRNSRELVLKNFNIKDKIKDWVLFYESLTKQKKLYDKKIH